MMHAASYNGREGNLKTKRRLSKNIFYLPCVNLGATYGTFQPILVVYVRGGKGGMEVFESGVNIWCALLLPDPPLSPSPPLLVPLPNGWLHPLPVKYMGNYCKADRIYVSLFFNDL